MIRASIPTAYSNQVLEVQKPTKKKPVKKSTKGKSNGKK